MKSRKAASPAAWASFFVSLWLLTGLAVADTLTGRADIVDGDTIKIGGIPVRLYGIDAPEGRQTCKRDGKTYNCGKEATKALANLIVGRSVQCEVIGKDDYGRALGVCTVADTELNRTMVRNGWALAFVKYSDRYASDQDAAEGAGEFVISLRSNNGAMRFRLLQAIESGL
jgi:endonuclease YncB( thermonuclease family)